MFLPEGWGGACGTHFRTLGRRICFRGEVSVGVCVWCLVGGIPSCMGLMTRVRILIPCGVGRAGDTRNAF